MSHTKKLTRARDQINKHAEGQRLAAKNLKINGTSTLPDVNRVFAAQHLESVAEGLELAAKIVEKLMRD